MKRSVDLLSSMNFVLSESDRYLQEKLLSGVEITEDNIEDFINCDTELMESLEYIILNEANFKDQLAIFHVVLSVLQLVLSFGLAYLMTVGAKPCRYFTPKIANIVKDDNVLVMKIKNDEPNAFVIFGRKMYYYTKLRSMLTDDEVLSILCHEYGHMSAKHTAKNATTSVVFTGVITVAVVVLIKSLPEGLEALVSTIVRLVSVQLYNLLYAIPKGREYEYYADSYARDLGYGKELASSLKKIDKWVRDQVCKDMTASECNRLMQQMEQMDVHPGLNDRLKNILKNQKFVNMLTNNNTLGAMRYLNIIKSKLSTGLQFFGGSGFTLSDSNIYVPRKTKGIIL